VKEKEKHAMRPNVLDFEPSLALFVKDDDPLVFYKKIMNLAECSRTEEVFFEINEALGAETMALGESNFKIQVLKKDFRGRDRMLHFQKD
jgi:release factor glutamine methyltransferase